MCKVKRTKVDYMKVLLKKTKKGTNDIFMIDLFVLDVGLSDYIFDWFYQIGRQFAKRQFIEH